MKHTIEVESEIFHKIAWGNIKEYKIPDTLKVNIGDQIVFRQLNFLKTKLTGNICCCNILKLNNKTTTLERLYSHIGENTFHYKNHNLDGY